MNEVHGAILSPFVRKVLLVLEHKGVPYWLREVMPSDSSPEFRALSPLGKIPAFRDEFVAICDSSVICDYLETKYPVQKIYPAAPSDRALALWLEEFGDTCLYDLLGKGLFFERVLKPRLLGLRCNEGRVRRSIEAARVHLDYLESQLASDGYLVGPDLSIADFIVPGVLLNARHAGFEVDSNERPKLASYLDRVFQHPLYVKRIEEEEALMRTLPAL